MCGIAGFLGPWSENLIKTMVKSLRHRGPDGDGYFFDQQRGLALGHTRLSIIDLSAAAAQPMNSQNERYILTFNGEIFNYQHLRKGLEFRGVKFRTNSDTEVLLNLFTQQGPSCVQQLHGIFAFAIWDKHKKELFLARDHLGVKPLYYAKLSKGFLFASELKVLTLCSDLPRCIDPVAVSDHVSFLWTAGEATMLRHVQKLRPGCTLTINEKGLHIERYYSVPIQEKNESTKKTTPVALRNLIDDVVKEQMVADVEVGALLSGGVDSSAIVASMCEATDPKNITTFSAAVDAKNLEEDNFGEDEKFAGEMAHSLGVKLIKVPMAANLIDELPAMVWSLDEPTADFAAIQTQILARAARQNGIKVLLSGIGGDDLFTGYGRHTAALLYAILDSAPGLRRVVSAATCLIPPGSLLSRRISRISTLLHLKEESMLSESMIFSGVTMSQRLNVLSQELREELNQKSIPLPILNSLVKTKSLHPVERLLDIEKNGFIPDHNLNYTDKMAMQEGVEVRVPLCDPKLVEFATKISLSDMIDLRQTKKILRKSQKGRLPESILARSKQGFGVPIRAWLKGPARPLLEDLTSSNVIDKRGLFNSISVGRLKDQFLAGKVDAAMTLFPLIALELWCRALDSAPTVN